MSSLLVIIVNYATASLIKPLILELDSVANIIVVDNYSDSSERELLAELEDICTVAYRDDNKGFAAGVNAGIALRDDPNSWVLLLNPDAKISADDVERLWRLSEANSLDISGPVILQEGGANVWFAGGIIDLQHATVRHITRIPSVDREFVPTDFVSGCIMLLSPSALREIFPISEDLFMYWEDVELCIQAPLRHLRVGIIPSTTGYHLGGASSDSNKGKSALYFYYLSRNRLILARRLTQVSWSRSLLHTPWWMLRKSVHILLKENGKRSRLGALFRGTWTGIIHAADFEKSSRS
jgi:N-acetylglucosaminyl-diphospho-decaprenol L-rhamnosyltransferase